MILKYIQYVKNWHRYSFEYNLAEKTYKNFKGWGWILPAPFLLPVAWYKAEKEANRWAQMAKIIKNEKK